MSQAQAYANHSLYMASIQIDAWQHALERHGVSNGAVDASFAPAVRLHLLDAYGWFLLACRRESSLPNRAPVRVSDLPDLAPGIEEPPEVREFQSLEQNGWLAELQAGLPLGLPARKHSQVLVSDAGYPDVNRAIGWRDALESMLLRQADAIEES